MIPKLGRKTRTRPHIMGFLNQIVGLQLFLHILNIGLLQKLKFKDAGKSASM